MKKTAVIIKNRRSGVFFVELVKSEQNVDIKDIEKQAKKKCQVPFDVVAVTDKISNVDFKE